jgi:hypothetical protein
MAPDTLQEPRLGEPGEACAECGSPLAADQRYCLNCGTRRGDPRLDYAQHLKNENGGNGAEGPPRGPGDPDSKQPGSGRDWTPFVLVGLVAALGMMLAIGVLIGKGGSGGSDQASAPVVQVTGTGTDTGSGTNLPTANTSFKSDWPSGKDGYTVELGTLPKQGTTADQVAAQTSDATSKGATDVGALDTDDYGSLPAGNYLIYSGVYDNKADATKALKSLKSNFPDAKVVQVSTKAAAGGGKVVAAKSGSDLTSGNAGSNATVKASDSALQDLQNQSGQNYADASKHLPNNVATSGSTVKNDNKDPGAGTPTQVIK